MAAFLLFRSPPRMVAMAASTVSGDMASTVALEAMMAVPAGLARGMSAVVEARLGG